MPDNSVNHFYFGRYGLQGRQKRLERIFEIVPGVMCWGIIIGMTVLSLTVPMVASVIIIAFVLYWLTRLIYMSILLMISYFRFSIEKNTNWLTRIEAVDKAVDSSEVNCTTKGIGSWRQKTSQSIHCGQIQKVIDSASLPPGSDDIYHVVIIPVVKETIEIVEPGIEAIENGSYPSKRILLMLALEERAAQNVKSDMYKLEEKHKHKFLDFIIALHPSDMPGEARVKGANATFAGRAAAEYFKKKSVPFENVIASCFDADTVPVRDYFSCLTYYFMITPNRLRTSYQPIPVYFNNIWDVPCFARVIDVGTSFFQLIETTYPKTLVTFSSHSMSFKALVEVGYWSTDIISDDSSIFWKCLIHYNGHYHTIPIPIEVSMDIVTGRTAIETFVNIYKQKRRWAWGVENFPIVMRGFLHSKTMSLSKKISFTWRLVDKFTSWSTWSFLLAFVSWLPIVFAGQEFASTTVYYITPRIRKTIFGLAFSGIVVCMLVSLMLLPTPQTKNRLTRLRYTAEWLIIPAIILILSALPALDAQPRLMLGKYMEFWVTDKYRAKSSAA